MMFRHTVACAALILASCSGDAQNDTNTAQDRSDPRGMLPRRDLAEQSKIDYATATRCLWLSQYYMVDEDPAVANATMRVQAQARFFANQRATEAGKGPAQVEQDLIDITAKEAVSAPPLPSECMIGVFTQPSQEDQGRCDAAQKEQSDKIARDIASGARPDRARMQRNEYTEICIPLLAG